MIYQVWCPDYHEESDALKIFADSYSEAVEDFCHHQHVHSLTEEQRHILAHSLGIVHYAQESYRNHFHSDPRPALETLVSAGYMTRQAAGSGWSASYYVTPEGERACREALRPTSPLFGWWLPDGARARAWHFVDQRRPPARGKHSCPETLCGTWLYRLKVPDLLQGDPPRPCQKCATALARLNRKVREVSIRPVFLAREVTPR